MAHLGGERETHSTVREGGEMHCRLRRRRRKRVMSMKTRECVHERESFKMEIMVFPGFSKSSLA